MRHPRLHTSKSTKAFTFTETAIMFAVVALVMGGVWAAASTVQRKARVNEMFGNIVQITQQMRKLYERQGGRFSGASGFTTGSNITTPMVRAEIFPSSMFNPTAPTTPQTPWNTTVRVLVGNTLDTFEILLMPTLSDASCTDLAGMAIGASRDPGLMQVRVGATLYDSADFEDLEKSDIGALSCQTLGLTFSLRG